MVVAVLELDGRARPGGRTARAARTRGRTSRARARPPGARGRLRPSSGRRDDEVVPAESSTGTPDAGLPAAVSSTWVESEQLTRRIFPPGPDGRARSRPRPRARARRRGRPPRRRRRAGRRGEARRRRARRRDRSAPPSSSPSIRPDREVGAPAGLERADVVASRAPRRRRGSRAGAPPARSSPPAPPRPRATSSACFTSAKRSLRSFDAEPSTPSPTRSRRRARSRTGATPAPRRRLEVGQWATPVPGLGEASDLGVGEVDAVRAPDVVREPAEPLEVLDRRAAVELAAVRLLLDRLREVRVERRARAAARAPRTPPSAAASPRTASTARRRSARARPGPPRGARRGAARCRRGPRRGSSTRSSGGRPPSESPRSIEPRDATMPHAQLARRLHLRLDDARAPAREDVVVVEDGRAARERELGEPGPRGGVLGLCVEPRPTRDRARGAR